MAKYMILYNSIESASQKMADASPEQMEASMAEWMQWREQASQALKVDFGLPLEARRRVTASGLTDSDSQVSGYSIMEGDSKDALLEVLKTHPHLKDEGSTIDVFEMLSMPGIES